MSLVVVYIFPLVNVVCGIHNCRSHHEIFGSRLSSKSFKNRRHVNCEENMRPLHMEIWIVPREKHQVFGNN